MGPGPGPGQARLEAGLLPVRVWVQRLRVEVQVPVLVRWLRARSVAEQTL